MNGKFILIILAILVIKLLLYRKNGDTEIIKNVDKEVIVCLGKKRITNVSKRLKERAVLPSDKHSINELKGLCPQLEHIDLPGRFKLDITTLPE